MSRGKITDDPFFVRTVKATNSNPKKNTKKPTPHHDGTNKKKSPKNSATNEEVTVKKPFDKKTWRLRKYSKKYKLEQWENKRKKAVLREYYKSIKNEGAKFDVRKIYEEADEGETTKRKNDTEETPSNSPDQKRKPYKKAHLEFLRIQEEKKKRKEEAVRKKAEREEALKNYKQKKLEKFKKLNRKTRKGQPIMKERMELLLEQIEKSVQN